MSNSNAVPKVQMVTRGMPFTTDLQRQREKCRLAVCGIMKQLDGVQGRCFVGTGSLVKDFFPALERKIHLVTSEKVIQPDNLNGYFLCFKSLKGKDKQPVKLTSVWNKSDKVIFTSGLAFVPVDPDRLGVIRKSRSGLVNHRPFTVCDQPKEDLSHHKLYCHVVDESGKSFVIRPFQLNDIADEQPFLTDQHFKFSQPRDFCGNNRKGHGAPIAYC